jgi:hypothetical protein
MFEVVETGPVVETKRWFRSPTRSRPVKLKAVSSTFVEKLGRTFEGYGNYSTQTYRATFTEGEVITIRFPESKLVAVGDRMSVEALAGQGYLNSYFRLSATTG